MDDLNTIAWRDFLMWAWNDPEMRLEFTAKTGVQIQSVASPINATTDEVTGRTSGVAAQFIEWATREHWGLEHAPVTYQKAISAKKKRRS